MKIEIDDEVILLALLSLTGKLTDEYRILALEKYQNAISKLKEALEKEVK